MKKSKKTLIIAIIIVLFCTAFFITKINKVEKIEILSENASEQNFQGSNQENEQVYLKSISTIKKEKGDSKIVYKSDNFFTNLKVSTMSIFNKYEIEQTIEFQELYVDNVTNSDEKCDISVATVISNEYSTEELLTKLNKKSWVISSIPNYELKTSTLTNDKYADIQWALQNNGQFAGTIGDDAKPITTSSQEEKVIAIVDTGVDYTNEDLVNVMWENSFDEETLPGKYGYDFVNDDNDPMDDYGHGTHCAGIIAAEANNEVGVSGAVLGASNVKIMALKVGDANGSIKLSNVINAYNYIYQAQQLGINVVSINNSWGTVLQLGTDQDEYIQQLIDLFSQFIEILGENGAISVLAAGNNGLDLDENGVYNNGITQWVAFPACIENDYEITVAATNSNDEIAYFSNYGDSVDMAAPGVDIYSTYKSGDVFNPDSSKKEEYCVYEDFEGDATDVINNIEPYIVVEQNDESVFTDGTSITSIEVTDEKFYGDSGKSLKISVDNSNSNKKVNLRFPLSKLGITDFSTYAVSLDLYVIQDTNGAGYKLANYGNVYNGGCFVALENENTEMYYRFGYTNIYESSYWHHWNLVYLQENYEELEYLDIGLLNLGKGTYTIYIDNLVITKDLGDDYQKVLTPYELQSGTSMAAPHVTASVAVASNQYENYGAKEIKNLILNGTRDNEKFVGLIKNGELDMQAFLKSQEIGLAYSDSYYNYDGKEHSINLNIVKPTTEVEVYYSTEKELTAENYMTGNTEKPLFTDPGEYTVYWYVRSTNNEYVDKYGSSKVVIDNKIIINGYNYNGKYDTKEHSIGLYTEVSTNEIEIYYSTEQALTSQNYNIVGNTLKPTFTDVGEYIVYWYAHSTNGKLRDVYGNNDVYIYAVAIMEDLDNEYIKRILTGTMTGYYMRQLKLDCTCHEYTGSEIKPIGALMFRGKELVEGKDYTIEYYFSSYDENNIPKYDTVTNPIAANNSYMAVIKGIGNFYGNVSTEEYTIEPRNIEITANGQKVLEGNQICTGVDAVTVNEDGLADGHVISEITVEKSVGENNQSIIKVSNAVIKDSANNDVTSNYNINYVDGKLTILTAEDVIDIQFNDIGLYKSLILGNNIEILYEDEENKRAIFEKNVIEQIEDLTFSNNYGIISDITGLSGFYNLKSLNMQNTNVKDIGNLLDLPNITEVKIDSSCKIEELENDGNKMILPQFLQVTAQTQNDAIITAFIHYGENNKAEISINKDESEKLYVILDNKASKDKPAGERKIEFKVSGGITSESICLVSYNVEAPLTYLEIIEVEEEENIVITNEGINSVNNILTRENFPNTDYEMKATDINGKILTDNEKIGTGTKIELKSDTQTKIFTVIIRGDVNGDGVADLKDILSINKHRLNKAILDGEFLLAGNINDDEIVDIKDILQINKFRLNKIDKL